MRFRLRQKPYKKRVTGATDQTVASPIFASEINGKPVESHNTELTGHPITVSVPMYGESDEDKIEEMITTLNFKFQCLNLEPKP